MRLTSERVRGGAVNAVAYAGGGRGGDTYRPFFSCRCWGVEGLGLLPPVLLW